MANRDVALGLTGVVVGVLLGAGSVLYTQEATLSASSTDEVAAAYFEISEDPPSAREIERAALEKIKDENRARVRTLRPIQQEEEMHGSAALPSNACDIAMNIATRMNAVISSIGTDVDSQYLIRPVQIVLDQALSDFCPEEDDMMEMEEEGMKRAAPARVDNDCEQYEQDSIRERKCLGNQADNLPYVD